MNNLSKHVYGFSCADRGITWCNYILVPGEGQYASARPPTLPPPTPAPNEAWAKLLDHYLNDFITFQSMCFVIIKLPKSRQEEEWSSLKLSILVKLI